MRMHRGVAHGAGALLLGVSLTWAGTAPFGPSPAAGHPEPKVGLVDLGVTLSTHRTSQDEEAAIEAWRVATEEELARENEKVEDLQAELDSYQRGSDEFIERSQELAMAEFKLKMRVDTLNAQLEKRRAKALRDAYSRVADAAERVRKNDGLDVILQVNPGGLLGRTRDEVIQEILTRTVVCGGSQVDITKKVISILDS